MKTRMARMGGTSIIRAGLSHDITNAPTSAINERRTALESDIESKCWEEDLRRGNRRKARHRGIGRPVGTEQGLHLIVNHVGSPEEILKIQIRFDIHADPVNRAAYTEVE